MSLSSAAIRRPVTTIATVLAFVLVGAVSLSRLPVALLPDVTLPVLTIRTSYPGAAALEVSRLVAEPIEEAIAATPGLLELRSVSRNAQVTTTASFAWGTDMPSTVLNVRERLDNARARLPEAAERPTLLTSDPGERPIAMLGLTGPGDLRSIARTAREVHARRLEQLDGVASVAVVGAPEDEIRVDVDPGRLRLLNLTTDDVVDALQNANWSAPGGTIRRGQFRFSVRALTEFQSLEEIGRIPLTPGGTVRLEDIGTVHMGAADPVTLVELDGRPAVGLVIYKDADANTVSVTREITEAIETLTAEFPDVHLTVVATQAEFVEDALGNLEQGILGGGILAILVVMLFLRDIRSSMAIALIIPLSVMVALVVLQFLDVSINVLSLGGLALGVGMLVDNAIVVSEATGRHREEGLGAREAARCAADEVAAPLIAGTLTTLLVFGPIIFVRGLAAALFRDLSLSVVTSVGASLILALTLMPVLLAARKNRPPEKTRRFAWADSIYEPLGRFGTRATALYERGMIWSLRFPWRVIGIAAAIVLVTTVVALGMPREILPRVDEGTVVVQLELAEGTAIEETRRQAGRIQSAAEELGAEDVYARIGAATDEEVLAGADPGGSGTAQLVIRVPGDQEATEFASRLREAVPDLAAGRLALDLAGQSEFGSLIGREGRIVRVEVSALRREAAERFADSARRVLRTIPNLADVRDAYSGTQQIVQVTLERRRIAEHGFTVEEVAGALAGGLGGVEATEFRETDRRTPIVVRLGGNANENLDAALSTTVSGVPLRQLVRVDETRAPIEVVRVDQRPVSIVEGVVEQGGTARAMDDVREALAQVPEPPGLNWELTGADVQQRRTTSELGVVAILSVALVFLVLAGEFASFTTPLVVMLTVPLAAAGGILLLWITGQSINAVSLIGLVVMIGVADNDAVVKLDAIRRFRDSGEPLQKAILMGGLQRLRPIAMTSITTIVGVLPLFIGLGSGGQLYQSLAAGVIGGSISATLVTFFLLPSAYFLMERRKVRHTVDAPLGATPLDEQGRAR